MFDFDNSTFLKRLDLIYSWVWGPPLLILLVGISIYLTFALRGLQFRYLGYALKLALLGGGGHDQKEQEGDVSHFQSLMTALAATIGIGNIAGVATAVTVGGMGALFWMWITALLGMAIKYSEALLSVKYRIVDHRGEMCGGPMYFIERGLGWKKLAICFAFFGAIASFGGGNMLQANTVADVLDSSFNFDTKWTAVALAIFTGFSILGGIRSIGWVASLLVPFMAVFYIIGGGIIVVARYEQIPSVLWSIFSHAFTGQAAFGGFAGASVMMAIQVGVSRGLMTSEAGLGTASIAAAAARTDTPGRQALVSMVGSFITTIIMCSVTGLVLGVTGVLGSTDAEGNLLKGATLTIAAFTSVIPWGGYVVTIGSVLFGFTTILGYAYYGEKCVEYLVGERFVPLYRIIFTLVVIPGALLELDVVWKISDITNALMALPNLIGLIGLSGMIVAESRDFVKLLQAEKRLAAEKGK